MISRRHFTGVLLSGTVVMACRDSAAEVPAFDQIQRITILTATDWRLDIEMDGSGRLIFGSNPMDVSLIPGGTVKPRAIYDMLAPTLQAKPSDTASIAVSLRKPGQISVTALYSDKVAEVTELFATASKAGRPLEKERFESVLKQAPPFPPAEKKK